MNGITLPRPQREDFYVIPGVGQIARCPCLCGGWIAGRPDNLGILMREEFGMEVFAMFGSPELALAALVTSATEADKGE